jgi:sarcosine oxidase subunit beta
MKTSADVVVIGAGVIGTSTAYHLAKMGIKDVILLEMDQVGSGASSKSASMLSLQFGSNKINARMAKYSYGKFMQFEHEVGTTIDFKRTGWITIAREGETHTLKAHTKTLNELEITSEIIDPAEIKSIYPELNTEDIAIGAWGPDDGPFDPHMILWGYMNRAKEMGVKLYQGVRATNIRTRGGQVVAVTTTHGEIDTSLVINAAGPWAIEVGRWVGVEIPIRNSARCVLVTAPISEIPSDRPFVKEISPEWYFRPEGEGILIGMGEVPTDDLNLQIHDKYKGEIVQRAVHRVPVLSRASVKTAWTGIRPLSPDSLPIFGAVPGVSGFMLNCGWGGMGIIQSPIAGQLMAELVSTGQCMTENIDVFNISRFD